MGQNKGVQRDHIIPPETPRPGHKEYNTTDNTESDKNAPNAKISSSVAYPKNDVTPEEVEMMQKEALENLFDILTKILVRETIGAYISLIRLPYQVQSHPVENLLNSYNDNGVPVECGPNWTYKTIQTPLLT